MSLVTDIDLFETTIAFSDPSSLAPRLSQSTVWRSSRGERRPYDRGELSSEMSATSFDFADLPPTWCQKMRDWRIYASFEITESGCQAAYDGPSSQTDLGSATRDQGEAVAGAVGVTMARGSWKADQPSEDNHRPAARQPISITKRTIATANHFNILSILSAFCSY